MFLVLGTWKSQASATVVLHLQALGRQGLSVCLHEHCAAEPGTQPDTRQNYTEQLKAELWAAQLVLNLGLPAREPCNLRRVTWQLYCSYDRD